MKSRKRFLPVLFIFLILVGFGFVSAGKADNCIGELMFSPELLDEAGLRTVWESRVSLIAGERISNIWQLGSNIYVLTSRNYLTCISKEVGNIRFARQIAAAGQPVFEPTLENDKLTFLAGNKIVELDPNLGSIKSQFGLDGFAASGGHASNSMYYYIPGSDNRLHVIERDSQLTIFKGTADDESLITSVVASDAFVTFGTATGQVVCMSPLSPEKFWQFSAVGPITAPLVRNGGYIYVSARDTNLYKISVTGGGLEWKFRSGGKLLKSARVTETTVYQSAQFKGLAAVDDRNGKEIWVMADGRDLLMEAEGRAYVITDERTLRIMDNETAEEVKTVNFKPVSAYVINSDDSRIYVGSAGGSIGCLGLKK